MKWSEIKPEHHLKKAVVWADSTPDHPETGAGPYMGYVHCINENVVPVLDLGEVTMFFVGYYDVRFVEVGPPFLQT